MIVKHVPPTCRCATPNAEETKKYGCGTVWQCDTCGRQARLVDDDQKDGILWMWLPAKIKM